MSLFLSQLAGATVLAAALTTIGPAVTLRGRVRSEPGRQRALELAGGAEGVRRALDELVIGR